MMRERSPELSRSGVRQLVDEAMHRRSIPRPMGSRYHALSPVRRTPGS